MDHETLGGRIPKGERRVRFADSMGMELVSIFLTDLFVLASHTPYTNYNENRKPPSSRLSSTLQAIQYKHDYHHNSHSSNANHNRDNTISKSIISTKASAVASNNKQSINNNNDYHNNNNNQYCSHDEYHDSGHFAPRAINRYHQQHLPSAWAHFRSTPAPAVGVPAQPTAQPSQQLAPSAPPSEYICEFTQPVSLISFKERVKLKKVQLENCYVNTTAGHVSLTCNVRVLNISYDKSVSVRYTTDDWCTHTDSLASYKPGSNDGWSDQFTSTISIINKLQPGQRIIFAVRYTAGTATYWDNNGGLDYSVKSKCSN